MNNIDESDRQRQRLRSGAGRGWQRLFQWGWKQLRNPRMLKVVFGLVSAAARILALIERIVRLCHDIFGSS